MVWNNTHLSKILLIEDDPVHARIMRRAFEDNKSNDEIVHLPDGESAMATLEVEKNVPSMSHAESAAESSHAQAGEYKDHDETLPNLILLDLRLPAVDGFEVLQAIRSNPRTRNIPVIMVSTSERQGDIRLSYSLGANAYITKPVDYTSFMEKLKALRDFWLKSAELPEVDPA